MRDFAAIDFETANECPSSVCSVGIVVVRDGRIADRFYSLIHPEPEYYQWFCRQVHGLGPEDTEDAPVFPILSLFLAVAYTVCFVPTFSNGKWISLLVTYLASLAFAVLVMVWVWRGTYRGRDVFLALTGAIFLVLFLVAIFGSWGFPFFGHRGTCGYWDYSVRFFVPIWLGGFESWVSMTDFHHVTPWIAISNRFLNFIMTSVLRFPGIISWILITLLLRRRNVMLKQTLPL